MFPVPFNATFTEGCLGVSGERVVRNKCIEIIVKDESTGKALTVDDNNVPDKGFVESHDNRVQFLVGCNEGAQSKTINLTEQGDGADSGDKRFFHFSGDLIIIK